MTFKHINFSDSPTMRSLEKIAISKGLVKVEKPLIKEASSPDLSVSSNLTENILKLCSGLRANGLNKYADEVESKFISYKKAEKSLYDVSGEEGEDLVDAAHPEGSHQLEGVSGDSIIETIIDKQLADLKMIDKIPTGKLSSAKDIICAVKNAINIKIAEELNPDELDNQCKVNIQAAINKFNILRNVVNKELWIPIPNPFDEDNTIIVSPTVSKINIIINKLFGSYGSFGVGILNFLKLRVSEEVGPTVDKLGEQIKSYLGTALSLKNKANMARAEQTSKQTGEPEIINTPATELKEVKIEGSPLSILYRNINNLIGKLSGWKVRGNISSNNQLKNWIDNQIKQLQDIENRYTIEEKSHPNQAKELISPLQQDIANEEKDINEFAGKFIK